MTLSNLKELKNEKGFTLVELAIVMIIIGLLIGGVLKGQELIKNAEITSTVAQTKAVEAAVSTFQDMYGGLPGDLASADTRIANCTGCDAYGDGNNSLDDDLTDWPASEGTLFFVELAAADLVGGVANDGSGVWGDAFPEAKAGGGFIVGSSAGGAFIGGNEKPGVYLGTALTYGDFSAGDTLTPNQAARIDRKLDDGNAETGSVVLLVDAGACESSGVYDETQASAQCDIAIRVR